MDAGDWARKHGLPVMNLHHPLIGELEKYSEQEEVVKHEIAAHREALDRWQTLVPIENATIRDGDGIVELPDGKICYEGNWWLGYLTESPSYKRRFEWKKRTLRGDIFSLISHWSTNYFHWFQDVLPRLETALPFLPAATKFLINSNPAEYQLKSLEAYGIDQFRLLEQPNRMHSKCERLWFATPLGHSGLTSGEILRRVAERIVSYFQMQLKPCDSHGVYISRCCARFRCVINESDLFPIFERNNIKLVVMEKHSFLQQLELCMNAKIIIGAHGAGLTNAMFCRNGTRVIELAAKGVHSHYLVSSQSMGLRFSRVPCIAVHPEDANSNIVADIQKLNEIIKLNINY